MSGFLIRLDASMTDEEWRNAIEQLIGGLVERHPKLRDEAARVIGESRLPAVARPHLRNRTAKVRRGYVT